jgi:hypothetical protein
MEGKIVARELDEKQAVRLAPGDVGERAPEQRDVGAEHQDVVVHELDRDRPEGDRSPSSSPSRPGRTGSGTRP